MATRSNAQIFTYNGFRKVGIIFSQFYGLFGFLLFNTFGIFTFVGAVFFVSVPGPSTWLEDPRLTGVGLAIWMIGASWILCSLLVNYFPTIWLYEEGLEISHFIFFRIFIPWTNIVSVLDQKGIFGQRTLVTAKRISILHRINSWFYFNMSYPCFVIGYVIEEKDTFVSKIRSKALFHSRDYRG